MHPDVDARKALLPLLSVTLACGNSARQGGDVGLDASGDGTVGQADADEAGGSVDGGVDDASGVAPTEAAITCAVTGWSERTGADPCYRVMTETCTDRSEFTVSCSCPEATCTCTRGKEAGGPVVGTATYAECPACADAGTATLFAACGPSH